VIFISHKLGEVQSVADRVVVLRGGKLAGERLTSQATRRELAELMVGGQLPVNEVGPPNPGKTLFELKSVSTRSLGGSGLNNVSMQLRGGEITGLAGDFRQWPGRTGGADRRHARNPRRRNCCPWQAGRQMVAARGTRTTDLAGFPKTAMRPA
jgi:hypothetical protein